MTLTIETWTRLYGTEKDKADLARSEAHRRMADHPFEPGVFGTCRRCGTDPRTSFDRADHPPRDPC
jgi:hypothetical protein